MKNQGKKPYYGIGTKRELILRYQTEAVASSELAELHGIGGSNTIRNWVEKAGNLAETTRPAMATIDKNEAQQQKEKRVIRQRRYEQARISELEAALEEARLRVRLYSTALDLVNQDLGENWLKKTGVESSDKSTKTAP